MGRQNEEEEERERVREGNHVWIYGVIRNKTLGHEQDSIRGMPQLPGGVPHQKEA